MNTENVLNLFFYWQTLAGFNDVDNFCDIVDALEAQGIEKHMDVSLILWL
jgi:hypothetical protein